MQKTLKKLTSQPRSIFIITLGVLVLLFIILRIAYARDVTTEPAALVEEYAKFLGGIVSMLFGFYLINVLWDQRMKAYQLGRFKKILAHFYLKIHALCQQTKQLLAKDFSTEENEESQQRDHRVREALQKLHSLGQGIDNYAPEVNLIDDEAMRDTAVAIWADIQTNFERLPVGQDFRIDLDEFEETIDELICATERGLELLRS